MPVDYVEQTIKSGVYPFEVEYNPIKSTSNGERIGFRSVLKINSIKFGTLYPEQYRMITNRNVQSVKLLTWCITKVIEDIKNLGENIDRLSFVTVYAPTKTLMRNNLDKILSGLQNTGFNYCGKIVIELSSDVLLEESMLVREKMKMLSNRYNVRFAICEFGDNFCPTLRLEGLPVSAVILDKTLSDEDMLNTSAAKNIVHFIKDCDMDVFLERTDSALIVDKGYEYGCDGYISGKAVTLNGATI